MQQGHMNNLKVRAQTRRQVYINYAKLKELTLNIAQHNFVPASHYGNVANPAFEILKLVAEGAYDDLDEQGYKDLLERIDKGSSSWDGEESLPPDLLLGRLLLDSFSHGRDLVSDYTYLLEEIKQKEEAFKRS